MSSVPALYASLVDDAGLFPPSRLPMPAALDRHRDDVAAAHPVLTHRFLCPASQLDVLRAHLAKDEEIRVGIIGDTGIDGLRPALDEVAFDDRVRVETVEAALPPGAGPAEVQAAVARLAAVDAQVFVELPRAPGWRDALQTVATAGLGAKVRCGGVRADLFPTQEELAAFVVAAVDAGLACKATAGLHHAVRHRDPLTGFDHHGFLNLLLAVSRAVQGAPDADVVRVLAIDDAGSLVGAARAVTEPVARATRDVLVAYGSCSTADPVADLTALDLI
ncbi:MAG TPA: hypothetical protein VFZ70_17050 [Euzebyales bacterium]